LRPPLTFSETGNQLAIYQDISTNQLDPAIASAAQGRDRAPDDIRS